MVITTTYSSSELLSSFARHAAAGGHNGGPASNMLPLPVSHVAMLPQHHHHHHHPCVMLDAPPSHVSHVALHPGSSVMSDSPPHKRSPLLCGYPSKKCWSWRVEKRNGELHKFCEYHRQKANTNQRRMEQRRKQGRPASPRASKHQSQSQSHGSGRRALKVSANAKHEIVMIKAERDTVSVSKLSGHAEAGLGMSLSSTACSPRGIDGFDEGSSTVDDVAMLSWMDAELDIGIGMDAAVEYMMVDPPVIDVEPSDTPVDLFEEDLYFLEHFIDEISHSAV